MSLLNKIRFLFSISLILLADCALAVTPKVVSSSTFAASDFSIALNSNGQVLTWGNNQYGQLGNGSRNNQLTPILVSGLSNVIDVAAGEVHALALKSDGSVWAWGRNKEVFFNAFTGQRGDNDPNDHLVPSQITSLSNITAISAHGNNSYALRNDGVLFAWGDNQSGQLGNGNLTLVNTATPTQVIGGNFKAVFPSDNNYIGMHGTVSAVKSNGDVYVWGYLQQYGFEGTATRILNSYQSTPLLNPNFSSATLLAPGSTHLMGLNADGTLWSWGSESGSNADRIPLQVLSNVKSIAANSSDEAFAVMSNGTVRAWGRDRFASHQANSVELPVLKYVDVVSGQQTKFAITNYGLVYGWGINSSGQLGDGTLENRNTPVRLASYNGLSALYLIPPINPLNNSFSNGTLLSGTSGIINGVVTELATKEAGEPNHANNVGGKSIWYTFTTTTAGQFALTPDADFKTLIAAYTGSGVSIANKVEASSVSSNQKLVFQAVPNTLYHIAIDGSNGSAGKVGFQWTLNPLAKADLTIKGPSDNGEYLVGQFTYVLTILNNGPQAASGVKIMVNIPSGVTFVSGPGCTNGTPVTCSVGTIDVGNSVTIPIVLSKPSTGNFTLTANVTTNTPEQNSVNNTFVANNNQVVTTYTVTGDIPTLPEWGMIIMAMLLILTSLYHSRKNISI